MFELFPRWTDEHVSHEQGMVGSGADNSNIDPIALVPAGITINHINAVSCIQIIDCALPVDFPHLLYVESANQLPMRTRADASPTALRASADKR